VKGGFQWCQHCGKPHRLSDRSCPVTGKPLEGQIHAGAKDGEGRRALPQSPLIGTVLDGKYRILRTIGAGGVGVVFEAENIVLGRLVAIKIVAKGGPDALLRLEREARLVAAIHHPNICDVYDVGRLPNGGPYVVLERLVGETLAAHIRTPRLPSLGSVLDIFIQVSSGLHAAHAMRILHRDLKPQNIFLVDRPGCAPLAKIVDFGFAQDLSAVAASRITRPGLACGTAQYMSPEQVRAHPLDVRSDLFALGGIIYETLTGRHPFAGPSRVDTQTNILRSVARPVSSWRRDIPRPLEHVIMNMLAKDPAQRPPSAYAVQQAFGHALEELQIEGTDDSAPSTTNPVWSPPSSGSTRR
jgi:serine/threonine protein kinase